MAKSINITSGAQQAKNNDVLQVWLSRTEYIVYLIVITHIALGVITFSANKLFFDAYIREDGYVENITALVLILTSAFFWGAVFRNGGWLRFLLLLVALVFLFGAGEEISWGQRILQFQTPEELREINTQGEFNLHNMKVNEVKLNKLIFSTVMYSGILAYFLVLPVLYHLLPHFRNSRFMVIPVPKLIWGLKYLGCFLLLFFIPYGKTWELQEFTFTVFLLTSLFFQLNPRFSSIISGSKTGAAA